MSLYQGLNKTTLNKNNYANCYTTTIDNNNLLCVTV